MDSQFLGKSSGGGVGEFVTWWGAGHGGFVVGGGSAQGSGWVGVWVSVSALCEYMTGAVGIMGNAVITASN